MLKEVSALLKRQEEDEDSRIRAALEEREKKEDFIQKERERKREEAKTGFLEHLKEQVIISTYG